MASTVSTTQNPISASQLLAVIASFNSQIQATVKWLQEAEERIRQEADQIESRIKTDVEERVRAELARRQTETELNTTGSLVLPESASQPRVLPDVVVKKPSRQSIGTFFNAKLLKSKKGSRSEDRYEPKNIPGSGDGSVDPNFHENKSDCSTSPVGIPKPEENEARLNKFLRSMENFFPAEDETVCTSSLFESLICDLGPTVATNTPEQTEEELDMNMSPFVSPRVKAARRAMDHVSRVTSVRTRKNIETENSTPRDNKPQEKSQEENLKYSEIPEMPKLEFPNPPQIASTAFSPLEWECEKCLFGNPLNIVTCSMCAAGKPVVVVIKPARQLLQSQSHQVPIQTNSNGKSRNNGANSKKTHNRENSNPNITQNSINQNSTSSKRRRHSARELSKFLVKSKSSSDVIPEHLSKKGRVKLQD